MSRNHMAADGGSVALQAFPLTKDKVNITGGTYSNIMLVHCVVDGVFLITWHGLTTDLIDCTSGTDYAISSAAKTITINSGTFHLA